MSIKGHYISIADPEQDILNIQELIIITEKGIESVVVMYDDHTLDKNASKNMLMLKDNLLYRISAVLNQYLFLIGHTNERSVIDLKKYPSDLENEEHPLISLYQNEISSLLDSVIFHLCSAFDYFGHFISYMFAINKDKTLDWDSLAKTSRSGYKDKYHFAKGVEEVDSGLRSNLEKYRSGLIHKRRDYHMVNVSSDLSKNILKLTFASSKESIKIFKKNTPNYSFDDNYSLDFFASNLIRKSFVDINYILPRLRADLLENSTFLKNIVNPKMELGFTTIESKSLDDDPIPVSSLMWELYVKTFQEFKIANMK